MNKGLQSKIRYAVVGTGLGLLVNVLSSLIAASLFEGTWPNILWVVFAVISGVAGYLLNGSAMATYAIPRYALSHCNGYGVNDRRVADDQRRYQVPGRFFEQSL